MYSISRDRTFTLWNVNFEKKSNCNCISLFKNVKPLFLSINSEGTKMIVGGEEGTFINMNLSNNEEFFRKPEDGSKNVTCFSKNGKLLAYNMASGKIIVCNSETGKIFCENSVHCNPKKKFIFMTGLAFHFEKPFLISLDQELLVVWNFESQEIVYKENCKYTFLKLNPYNGDFIFYKKEINSRTRIMIAWNFEEKKEKIRIDLKKFTGSVKFNPTGKYFALSDIDNNLSLFSAIDYNFLYKINFGFEFKFNFDREGDFLLISNHRAISIYHIETMTKIREFNFKNLEESSTIFGIDKYNFYFLSERNIYKNTDNSIFADFLDVYEKLCNNCENIDDNLFLQSVCLDLSPFKISLLNMIMYTENINALQNFLNYVERTKSKVIFKRDIFGNNALNVCPDNQIMMQTLINFMINNNENFISTDKYPLLIDSDITILLTNNILKMNLFLDSRLISPLSEAPTLSRRLKKDFLTADYKSLRPPSEFYEKLTNNKQSGTTIEKINISCLDIRNLIFPKSEFLPIISVFGSENEIFKSEALNYLLDLKWKSYALREFLEEAIIFFLVFLLVNINSITLYTERSKNGKCNNGFTDYAISGIVFDSILFLFVIWYAIEEIKQIKKFMKRNKFGNYMKSPWNSIDWIFILLMISNLSLDLVDIFGACIKEASRIMHATTLFFVYLKMLSYFRCMSGFSSLIRIIIRVIYDVRFFISILLFFSLSLSFSSKY